MQGGLRFDAAKAEACRSAISASPCTIGPRASLFRTDPCGAIFTAGRGAGDPCSLGIECGEGTFCDASEARCPGTCQALLGNNQLCDGTVPCGAGLYCSVISRRCLAQTDRDGPCEPSLQGSPCVEGSYCDTTPPGPFRCAAGRGRGAGCSSDAECATNLACHGGTCSLGQAGDGCDLGSDCADGLVCTQSKCRAPVAEGAPCEQAACFEGFVCTSSQTPDLTCVERPGTGDSCEDGGLRCHLGFCKDGTCAPAVADGAPCTAASECLPGRSCESGACSVKIACP
jgi:hypothetical protein